jgi:hypothetical protein
LFYKSNLFSTLLHSALSFAISYSNIIFPSYIYQTYFKAKGSSDIKNVRDLENILNTYFTWGMKKVVILNVPKSEYIDFTISQKLEALEKIYLQLPNKIRIKLSGV